MTDTTSLIHPPKNILMIKSHSLGVGDLLRSSAAWRALKDHWPDTHLHLLFLSKHKGYATEELMHDHHLLDSAHFVTIREGHPGDPSARATPWPQILARVDAIVGMVNPDLIIDFEPHGLRTSILTWRTKRKTRALTIGVRQVPGRGLFYDICAPSFRDYAKQRNLPFPLEYTYRDFVALSALGIERENRPIELQETEKGRLLREKLGYELKDSPRPIIGLNIGCGTHDALPRRPDVKTLSRHIAKLHDSTQFTLLLTGAPFERDVNHQFISFLREASPSPIKIIDLAGTTSVSELTGVIASCNLFISSDSGPYHMDTAQRIPTVALFNFANPEAYHDVSWARILVTPSEDDFIGHVRELLDQHRLGHFALSDHPALD